MHTKQLFNRDGEIMKLLLTFTFLFSAATAQASLPAKLWKSPCKKQIEAQLARWESKDEWIEKAPLTNKAIHFATPTKTFGRWVSVHANSGGNYLLESRQLSWQESVEINKNCKVALPQRHMASVFSNDLKWTDKDLQGITKSNRPTLVYIWSPGMVYSVKNHQTFVKAARDLKMNFVSMLDPQSELAYARYALRDTKKAEEYLSTRRLHAMELIERNGTVHYPTAFVIKNRTISTPIVGVYTEDTLKAKIQMRMKR